MYKRGRGYSKVTLNRRVPYVPSPLASNNISSPSKKVRFSDNPQIKFIEPQIDPPNFIEVVEDIVQTDNNINVTPLYTDTVEFEEDSETLTETATATNSDQTVNFDILYDIGDKETETNLVNDPLPTNRDKPLVLYIGHSWFRRTFNNYYKVKTPPIFQNFNNEFVHVSTYQDAIVQEFQTATPPSIVFIHLGSNDLGSTIPYDETKTNALTVTSYLQNKFPFAKFVISQIEERHYLDTVDNLEYKRRSTAFNDWQKRQLRQQRLADKILLIRGVDRLSDCNLYNKDGIHLTDDGQKIFLKIYASFLERLQDCTTSAEDTPLLRYCCNPGRCTTCTARIVTPLPTTN